MLRQLPPTITADKSPEWLPAGWIAQSTVLKSGRESRSYTHLETRQKLYTKDDVLQYIKMEKVRESRYAESERAKSCASSFIQHGTENETIKNPHWLPDNWTFEVRFGSRGNNTYKVYTNLSTGYKCYNKRSVLRCLQYPERKKLEEKQINTNTALGAGGQVTLMTNEQPEWLPENWIMEMKTTRRGVKHKIYIDLLSGCKCYSKAEVTRYLDTLKCEGSSKKSEETGTSEDTSLESEEHEGSLETSYSSIEEATYKHPVQLPANPKMKMRTRKRGLSKEKQIEPPSPPARRRKLKSRATRRRLFEDDDTSSSGDYVLSEDEASTDEIHDETNSSEVELVVSHLAESLAEEDLHDVVVEFDDQTKGISGLTGSFGAEVNVTCQCASTYVGTDSLPERDLNESTTEEMGLTNIGLASRCQNNGKDGVLTSESDSVKDEITQESGCRSKEPIKAVQALQKEQPCPEEIANEPSQLLFFPFKDAPTDADHVLAFDTSTATLSAEDLGNTFGLASKSCSDNPWKKNICSSKMQKKGVGTSLSNKIKDKDPQIPCTSTEQPEKPDTPSKRQGERCDRAASEKTSMSAAVDQNERLGPYGLVSESYWPHDFAYKNPSRRGTSAGEGSSRNSRRPARQQMDHWLDPCPEFVFESLTSSPRKEDDSVIRRYLEEHTTAAGTADSDLPLPDFGLPSFAHAELSSV